MNAITKTMSFAVLVASGLALGTQAAEPPKPDAPAGSWPTWCGGPDRNAVSLETGLVDGFEEWDGKGVSARSPIPESSAMPHEEWLYAAWAEGEGIETAPCIWTLLPHRRLHTVEPQLDVHREGGRITVTASAYAHAVGHDDEGGGRLSDNWFDLLPGLPKTIVCHGANPEAVRFMYAGPNGWAGLGSGRNAEGKPVFADPHGRRRQRHGGDPQ